MSDQMPDDLLSTAHRVLTSPEAVAIGTGLAAFIIRAAQSEKPRPLRAVVMDALATMAFAWLLFGAIDGYFHNPQMAAGVAGLLATLGSAGCQRLLLAFVKIKVGG
ncbi:hypothetical protein UFOVP78_53 [uncultured Caudovirales phage]|uniref:Uncharacterized protein n=1 Tax=uncultured Caudovirales phage TaxID=2100421 RepID=A0A6J5KXI3_9CAUD|nr:hypothetical protein UFOVP78_53 [uncultured Caudovirales phage]